MTAHLPSLTITGQSTDAPSSSGYHQQGIDKHLLILASVIGSLLFCGFGIFLVVRQRYHHRRHRRLALTVYDRDPSKGFGNREQLIAYRLRSHLDSSLSSVMSSYKHIPEDPRHMEVDVQNKAEIGVTTTIIVESTAGTIVPGERTRVWVH
jgi:hypothetical protein